MQDDTLYNMTDNTEYQANLFAADLLIEDEEIEDMVQNEDLDYFGLCSSLNATPELMSFKLYSLTKRGQAYHIFIPPLPILVWHSLPRIRSVYV